LNGKFDHSESIPRFPALIGIGYLEPQAFSGSMTHESGIKIHRKRWATKAVQSPFGLSSAIIREPGCKAHPHRLESVHVRQLRGWKSAPKARFARSRQYSLTEPGRFWKIPDWRRQKKWPFFWLRALTMLGTRERIGRPVK
jgi:hypothetical protein